MSLQDSIVSQIFRNASGGTGLTCKPDWELAALQEELHRSLASELHDSTCQHLIAASLGVTQVRNALGNPLKAQEYCEQVDLSINSALKELSSLAYLLHPQSVFEGGLKNTIERFAEGFAIRTTLAVEVSISPAIDSLSRETQRSLMRIVQEALTNVYRHARATRVDITVEVRRSEFQLEVRDDGQGMAASNRGRRLGLPVLGTGLRIMQARIEEMEGRLEILSDTTASRRGTTLRATFPRALAMEQNGGRTALKESS